MANAFRSFLEKIGLVAPETAATPTPAPSEPAQTAPSVPEAPVAAPEAAPFQADETPSEACNSDHVECLEDPKGCCELNAPHEGEHHCQTCQQNFS